MKLKKISICGLALIATISMVGCGRKQDLNVTFENYYYQDTKDGSNIEEYIEVSVDSNEISKYSASQILDKMGNKRMDTKLRVKNLQGIEIATVEEIGSKTTVKVDDEYKTSKRNNVVLLDSSKFKQMAELERGIVARTVMDATNDAMESFIGLSDTIKDDLNDEYLKKLMNAFKDNDKPLDISQVINKSKEIKDYEELTLAVQTLNSANKAYGNMIEISKEYKKNNDKEELKRFKSALLEFKRYVATYQAKVNDLDDSDYMTE